MAKQTEIGYEGKEWKSYQTGGTLVRAADLNNIENGIVETCAAVDELRTKRLPTYVVAQDGDTATQDVYTDDILGPCLILDLATRTTYYETGGEEEGHRKALVSGNEIDDIRDSVSQSPRFVIGCDVWRCSSNTKYVQMWTSEEFLEKFGCEFDDTLDYIAVMNGNARTQPYANVGGCYFDSGTIGCYVSGHESGSIEITYLVAFHR